jgi:hypothetical protein
MKKREDIVQRFSTFLSLCDRHLTQQSIWQADLHLERQMKRLVQSDPEAKEEYWARHFLKMLRECGEEGNWGVRDRSYSLPVTNFQVLDISTLKTSRHLSAYLQEACLWAANKSYQKFSFIRHKYPLEEYFQIASSIANLPAKLLKSYNLEHPHSNIEGYAKTAIWRLVRDKIYQQDLEAKGGKFSDYGLLKDLNNKELKEALASEGINQQQIELYRLAWQCFNEIYQPQQSLGSRSLEPPTKQQLKQIADYYNQQLNRLDLPASPGDGDKIKEMLALCIKAARNYRTGQFFPIEDYSNLSDPMPTFWDVAIQEEETQQVQLLVSGLFATIPEAGQTMLILWQGLNLTQSEIATVIKNKYPELQKQYQVARHLARYTKNLLRDFANEWNQVNPGNSLNDEQDLERIRESLDECLESHCKQLLGWILEPIKKQVSEKVKSKKTTVIDEYEKFAEVNQSLTNALIAQLENTLNLPADALSSASKKVSFFVQQWLHQTDQL